MAKGIKIILELKMAINLIHTLLQLLALFPVGLAHSGTHARAHALQVARQLSESSHHALLPAGRSTLARAGTAAATTGAARR